MKVLVTGATGVVGRALVPQLISRGFKVRIFSRSAEPVSPFFSNSVHWISGDITDVKAVLKAASGVKIIFHLAAKLSGRADGEKEARAYNDINVRGTRILMDAAQKNRVDRVVFFSSISVYGRQEKNQVADELSVLSPDSLYSRSKARAETHVLGRNNYLGEPLGVVLRVASVYGPAQKRFYSKLIKMVDHGFFISVGRGKVRRTMIHDSDLARAALMAALHPKARGCVYNVTDGRIHRLTDCASAIGAALGKDYIQLSIPKKLVEAGLAVLGKRLENFPGLPWIAATLDKLVRDCAVSGNRICSELGFRPCFELNLGWKDAVKRSLKR